MFQTRQNKDGERQTVINNYLMFDAERIFHPFIAVRGYGEYGREVYGGPFDTQLYYLYLHYRTFEGASEIKLGRFPLETQRFLAIDGAYGLLKLSERLTATAYAGFPHYYDIDPERFDRDFNGQRGFMVGARLNLTGVEYTRAFVGYSREGKWSDVYRSLASIGAGRDFNTNIAGKEFKISADGIADFNVSGGGIDKLSARVLLSYAKRLRVILEADRYDVKNEYPDYREFVISMMSAGREDRAFYTVSYDIFPELSAYQSTVLTRLKMPDSRWQNGYIVKGGVTGNYVKSLGIDMDAGIYRFKSYLANATGITSKMRWRPAERWFLDGGFEYVFFDTPYKNDKTAKTFLIEAAYMPKSAIKVALFAEHSDNPDFKTDFRAGLRIDYQFGFRAVPQTNGFRGDERL